MVDLAYTERSMHVIEQLVEVMNESREWLLEEHNNAPQWCVKDEVQLRNFDPCVVEEVEWLKSLLWVAVIVICVLFALLIMARST